MVRQKTPSCSSTEQDMIMYRSYSSSASSEELANIQQLVCLLQGFLSQDHCAADKEIIYFTINAWGMSLSWV